MRIAQVSTLATPVAQEGSGAVESLVWLLDRQLSQLGHEVTVFACAGSETTGDLVATVPGPYEAPGCPSDWQMCEWINLCRAVEQSDRFDAIHSHSYLWSLALDTLSRAPMVHTTHVMPDDDAPRVMSLTPAACLTAISEYQWSSFPALRPTAVIHHGVNPDSFTFKEGSDGYLCYLGRFTPGKGACLAIEVARALGMELVLAGPWSSYYQEAVQPLVDGKLIQYVGPVAGPDRDDLLHSASALLYPIQQPEPFGLVTIEAMMCGTPVVALSCGATPEIVEDGITGALAATPTQLVAKVPVALALDRRLVRHRAEVRFSADRMARDYLDVYTGLVDDRAPTADTWPA